MKKSILSSIVFITLVIFVSISIVFLIATDSEAGPTKFKVHWGWYKCSEIDTNIVCIPWVILIKVKPIEGWWHKRFGEHPHGHDFEYIEHNRRHQRVLSCSKCDWELGGIAD